ncbi:MAG: hypothetical protein GF344_01995 [Chitinivibrionales bacterium]|nr:hypothetical protein [Chitinivibrionales bacterium]MBD3355867.1 hypothetical protein [Chitinivibrionales bacterium]
MRTIGGRRGMTLVELVIATAVTGTMILILFTAYGEMIKGFSWNTRHAAGIQEMILVRAGVSGVLKEIEIVVSWRKNALEYREKENDSPHTLVFREGTLYHEGEMLVADLDSFSLDVRKKQAEDGRRMLVWEAKMPRNRWVGGAWAVSVEE